MFGKNRRQRVQIRRRDEPSVWIVRVDDDGDILVFQRRRGLRRSSPLRRWRPAACMLAIGKAQNSNPPRRHEVGEANL